jgi:hypothetical protein
MTPILGIPISNKQFKMWMNLLVYFYAPFVLTDRLKARVPTLHLSRNEFTKTIQDLTFHDAYTTYAVGSEATWVTLLNDAQLQRLPTEV